MLPGSACENGIGTPLHYTGETDPDTLRAPRQRYAYLAPLWLQREVDIPADFAGQAVTLFLERVNMASRLWVDDLEIGRQIVELSAPHIYDLTGKLTPGRHTLTLRLDNRDLLSLGDMASGYSPDTQDYWIGVVGRIELQICPPMPCGGCAGVPCRRQCARSRCNGLQCPFTGAAGQRHPAFSNCGR